MSSDELTRSLEELLRRSALLETGIANLGKRLETLENDQRFDAISNQIHNLHNYTEAMHKDLSEQIAILRKKIEIMNRELLEVKTDNGRLNDRVDALEKQPA
jgi:chromosome segregation ATPase